MKEVDIILCINQILKARWRRKNTKKTEGEGVSAENSLTLLKWWHKIPEERFKFGKLSVEFSWAERWEMREQGSPNAILLTSVGSWQRLLQLLAKGEKWRHCGIFFHKAFCFYFKELAFLCSKFSVTPIDSVSLWALRVGEWKGGVCPQGSENVGGSRRRWWTRILGRHWETRHLKNLPDDSEILPACPTNVRHTQKWQKLLLFVLPMLVPIINTIKWGAECKYFLVISVLSTVHPGFIWLSDYETSL